MSDRILMLTIRPARAEDEAFLVALTPRLADFPLPVWRTADEIAQADRQLLHDALAGALPHSAILVAELSPGGGRAGYVFATTKHDYFTRAAHAHVEILAVEAAAQGRGVARALMDAVEEWARRRGYTWVTLNVFDRNTRAKALYDRLGYEPETIHYRKTLSGPRRRKSTPGDRRAERSLADEMHPAAPIELVVLALKERAARCRLLHSDGLVTLRATRLWDVVPGEIVVVKPRKQWRYAGHPYLSGEIESTRLDVKALGLTPLRLEGQGAWDPLEEYWGEDENPIEEWAKPIIARGPRPSFEMEQVLPGTDPDDPDGDPICLSNDLRDAGDGAAAFKILMDLCQADLRCLDAHAHLGNFVFGRRPQDAIRHYEVGVRIGGLSLGDAFDGVLPWGFIDNRPFLRCLQGFGLCLWRLGRFDEAALVFDRMLWLNPSDNQGVRFLVNAVSAGTAWSPDES